MRKYPGEYVCPLCSKLNHRFLRCLCWARDDHDWPHKDEQYGYSFVSTCTVQVQWATDLEKIQSGYSKHDDDENWGFDIDYIPEIIVMDQPNPFDFTIWTPEGVAYNLKHAARVVCRYTETPRWNRYHVWKCGNISEECSCCCGDDVEENEFYSEDEMREILKLK